MDKEPLHIAKYDPRNAKKRIKEQDKAFESAVRDMASCGLSDKEIAKFVGTKLSSLKKKLSDKEIAKFVGTKLSSLKKKLQETPTLEAALVQGRSEATQKLVAMAYRVAMGGMVTQKIKERINGRGEKSIEILTEEHPPNPQMIQFWLTNQAPDTWKYSRQLIKEDLQGLNTDGKTLESDKIARLSREIFESNTDGAEREHTVSETTAQPVGEGTQYEGDLRSDVQRKAADNIQDDVLDVSAEERTELVQAPPV
jgi:hypothetical protein